MSKKTKRHKSQSAPVTGKELSEGEEANIMLNVLVEVLARSGTINKKEYERLVAMRLHELSKARAFEGLDQEL